MIDILGLGFAGGCIFAAVVFWLAANYYLRRNPTNHIDMLGGTLSAHLPERSNDIIYYFDVHPKLRLRFACPPLESMIGEEKGKQAYRDPKLLLSLLHPEDHDTYVRLFQGEAKLEDFHVCRMKFGEQEYTWYEDRLVPIHKNGRLVAIQGVLRNVDNRVRMQEMLKYRVFHDSMTGLYSREYFEEMMESLNKEDPKPLTLAICDMDELKRINDAFGHRMGDNYIKAAANMLKQFASDHVVISRIGGDEFSILIFEKSEEEGKKLIERISQAAAEAEEAFAGIKISMSVGQAYTVNSAGRMDELFELADSQMYERKMSKRRAEHRETGTANKATPELDTLTNIHIVK